MQSGGIYFGDSRKSLNLAGINFCECPHYLLNVLAKYGRKRVLLGKLKTSVEGNKIWRKSILANDQKFNFDMKILANLDNFLRDSPNSAKKFPTRLLRHERI